MIIKTMRSIASCTVVAILLYSLYFYFKKTEDRDIKERTIAELTSEMRTLRNRIDRARSDPEFHDVVERLGMNIERATIKSDRDAMIKTIEEATEIADQIDDRGLELARESDELMKKGEKLEAERVLIRSMRLIPDRDTARIRQERRQLRMVRIPPGEFLMGAENPEPDTLETPFHKVRITKPFEISAVETTQVLYERVMGSNPSWFSNKRQAKDKIIEDTSNYPVEKTTWYDAIEFCNRLSDRLGYPRYYHINGKKVTIRGGNGYRLPTEAEWEYACRAGSKTIYCYGDDVDRLGDYAWYGKNSKKSTQRVGLKKPNAFGLYDMHGNVWEWCFDSFTQDFYKSAGLEDPVNVEITPDDKHMLRGGSFFDIPTFLRASFRSAIEADDQIVIKGFRVCRFP